MSTWQEQCRKQEEKIDYKIKDNKTHQTQNYVKTDFQTSMKNVTGHWLMTPGPKAPNSNYLIFFFPHTHL